MMKVVCFLFTGLLTCCEFRKDCDGEFVSKSTTESQEVGLLLHPLRPHTPADGFFAFANSDTVWIEQSWVERTAIADCQAANERFTVVPGKTLVIKLTRQLPNEVALTLNGKHPMEIIGYGSRLVYNLGESAEPPQMLTFHLYSSPVGSFFSFANNRLVKTWSFTR